MTKNNRRYRITIRMVDGPVIVITPPLTIQFHVERSISSSLNTMLLVIYNLGEVLRNEIFQDPFITLQNNIVILEAGYGDNLSVIFQGYIRQAYSARQGSNILTTIHAMDGGFDVGNVLTSKTLESGVTLQQVITNLIGDFPNLNQGVIGDFPGEFKRPVVLDGNTFDLLRRYTNNQVFIDLEKVNVLQNDEAVVGDVPVLSSATGLLESPQRADANLNVTSLFEPRIIMAQVIDLQSEILKIYNGQYKVIGMVHSGIISEAVGGSCTSRFNLLLGSRYFGRLKTVEQT